jgi:antitoxin component YwqK of YwqJK toxin-antitoxin module
MASNASEVRRKYAAEKGGFIFYRGGDIIAWENHDNDGYMQIEGSIPDGIVNEYYEDENGNETQVVFAEWNYKDNRLEGISRIYDRDGYLEEEFDYYDGKLDKILKKYYENGHLSFESTLNNCNGHASCKQYV